VGDVVEDFVRHGDISQNQPPESKTGDKYTQRVVLYLDDHLSARKWLGRRHKQAVALGSGQST
jgi:hypothetical protein